MQFDKIVFLVFCPIKIQLCAITCETENNLIKKNDIECKPLWMTV